MKEQLFDHATNLIQQKHRRGILRQTLRSLVNPPLEELRSVDNFCQDTVQRLPSIESRQQARRNLLGLCCVSKILMNPREIGLNHYYDRNTVRQEVRAVCQGISPLGDRHQTVLSVSNRKLRVVTDYHESDRSSEISAGDMNSWNRSNIESDRWKYVVLIVVRQVLSDHANVPAIDRTIGCHSRIAALLRWRRNHMPDQERIGERRSEHQTPTLSENDTCEDTTTRRRRSFVRCGLCRGQRVMLSKAHLCQEHKISSLAGNERAQTTPQHDSIRSL